MNTAKYFAWALLLAAISGCSSHPMSSALRQQERQITFAQVRANPDGTSGSVVIWGGRIINVVNDTNGSSIYIFCLPVRSNGKPVAEGASPGRFIAFSTEFLDPEMFPSGSRITVGGPLNGVWTEPFENMEYTYPVVQAEEVRVWQESPPSPPRNVSVSFGPTWNPYWANPYWGPGPYWAWYGGVPVYYTRPGFRPGFHGSVHVSRGVRGPPPARRVRGGGSRSAGPPWRR